MGVLRSCRANRWGLEPWSTASIFQLRTDIFLGPIFSWENASGFWIILWIWAWRLKTQTCRRYWSSDLGQQVFLLCVCVTPQKKNRPTCPKVVFNCTRTSLFFGGNHRKSQPFSVDFLPTQCFTASISGCRLAGRHRTSTGVTLRTNEGPGVHPEKMGR